MNLLCPSYVEEAYHFALKAEEKLVRKSQAKNQGSFRGRGLIRRRGKPSEASNSSWLEPTNKGSDNKCQ